MAKHPMKAVIVDGIRTPVGKAGKSLKDLPASQLGESVIRSLCKRNHVHSHEVDQFIFGHGYVHGGGLNSARQASLAAGAVPESTAHIVIQACGSSLQAIWQAALAIEWEESQRIIAGGMESMSRVPHLLNLREGHTFGHTSVRDAMLSDGLTCSICHQQMGVLAEKIAERYEISREEQDEYAIESHRKAYVAEQNGWFRAERNAPLNGLLYDESIRTSIDRMKMAALPTVFDGYGTVTAGNSCPMNDGAAAVLMISEAEAVRLGYQTAYRIIGQAVAGVDAEWMGIGPVPAVEQALKQAGLTLSQMDWIELNEAFAAQVLGVVSHWQEDVPDILRKINPLGGAIALGHPVGATGAILVTRTMHGLYRTGGRYGLITLCMAGGMGWAMIIERIPI